MVASCSIAILRLAIGVPFLASCICMGVAKQHLEIWGTRAIDWPSLRYFVIATAIASFYNIVVIWLPSGSMLWRLVAVVDLYVTSMVLAAVGAASGDISLMMGGSPVLGSERQCWSAICDILPRFCFTTLFAICLSGIGLAVCFVLFTYTLHVLINPLLDPRFPSLVANSYLKEQTGCA